MSNDTSLQSAARYSPLWRQPLVHFLLVAALIFALNAVRGTPAPDGSNRIVVTVAQVQRMAALWQTTWGRAPSESELQALVRDHIREEIYYREALKLGLDVNDTVIRRRLRQKMEYLTTDELAPGTANDAQLRAYFAQHAELYRESPVFDFIQVYVAAASASDSQQALAALRTGGRPQDFGEPISLPGTMAGADETSIVRSFGTTFFAALDKHEPGDWFGPVESGFGTHLVKINRKDAARIPALEEIRAVVENDWLAQQASASKDAAYQKLRAGYEVDIEVPPE